MATDLMFDMFHKYNRLVRRGLVKPLACTRCGNPVVTSLTNEDALVLVCFTCDSEVKPGKDTIANVGAVVGEHFVNEK
jgi:hypothetical protein